MDKLKIQREKLRSRAARLEQEGLALLAQAKQAAAEVEVLNEKIQVCLAADGQATSVHHGMCRFY